MKSLGFALAALMLSGAGTSAHATIHASASLRLWEAEVSDVFRGDPGYLILDSKGAEVRSVHSFEPGQPSGVTVVAEIDEQEAHLRALSSYPRLEVEAEFENLLDPHRTYAQATAGVHLGGSPIMPSLYSLSVPFSYELRRDRLDETAFLTFTGDTHGQGFAYDVWRQEITFSAGQYATSGTGYFELWVYDEGPIDLYLRVGQIPEPETYALFGMGLIGMFAARHARPRKKPISD